MKDRRFILSLSKFSWKPHPRWINDVDPTKIWCVRSNRNHLLENSKCEFPFGLMSYMITLRGRCLMQPATRGQREYENFIVYNMEIGNNHRLCHKKRPTKKASSYTRVNPKRALCCLSIQLHWNIYTEHKPTVFAQWATMQRLFRILRCRELLDPTFTDHPHSTWDKGFLLFLLAFGNL